MALKRGNLRFAILFFQKKYSTSHSAQKASHDDSSCRFVMSYAKIDVLERNSHPIQGTTFAAAQSGPSVPEDGYGRCAEFPILRGSSPRPDANDCKSSRDILHAHQNAITGGVASSTSGHLAENVAEITRKSKQARPCPALKRRINWY